MNSLHLIRQSLLLRKDRASSLLGFRRNLILGLESSCDDTGAAVINSDGWLMGEALHKLHSEKLGGVIPSIAMGTHTREFPRVTQAALKQAGVEPRDLKAIAITNRPGLKGSLSVGLKYAQYLSLKHNVPLIPIHHMEAHALMVRMFHKDIEKFLLLGGSSANSPGETMDKMARCLRLASVRPDLANVSGGRAIEILASEGGDPTAIEFPLPRSHYRDCNFCFSGMKSYGMRLVEQFESEQKLLPGQILSNANDLAASLQYAIARHISNRLQRGLVYCDRYDLWPPPTQRILVVSGGVASNQMIRSSLEKVCSAFDVQLVCPPVKYCTDNGVMIAWNGLEKLRRGHDLVSERDAVLALETTSKVPLGVDVSEKVAKASIKCDWINILS